MEQRMMCRRAVVGGAVRAGLGLAALWSLGACTVSSPRRSAASGGSDRPDLWRGGPVGGGVKAPPRPPAAPGGGSRAGYFDLPEGVIPRTRWTSAGVIVSRADPMVRVERITVHHDAMDSRYIRTQGDAVRRLESIRAGHVGRSWADIGYHFIVDPMGNVWEGRPLRYQGAHVADQNPRNMGVMVMGNFMEQSVPVLAARALDAFVLSQMRRYGVPVSRVYTHRELGPTLCPGTSLQAHMGAARSRGGELTGE